MWNVTKFADRSQWPTDGSKPFVYSMNLGCVPISPLLLLFIDTDAQAVAPLPTVTTSSAGKATLSRRPWTTAATSTTRAPRPVSPRSPTPCTAHVPSRSRHPRMLTAVSLFSHPYLFHITFHMYTLQPTHTDPSPQGFSPCHSATWPSRHKPSLTSAHAYSPLPPAYCLACSTSTSPHCLYCAFGKHPQRGFTDHIRLMTAIVHVGNVVLAGRCIGRM